MQLLKKKYYKTFCKIVFEMVLKIASGTVHEVTFDSFLTDPEIANKIVPKIVLQTVLNLSFKLLSKFSAKATQFSAQLRRFSSLTFLHQILVLSQCLCGE